MNTNHAKLTAKVIPLYPETAAVYQTLEQLRYSLERLEQELNHTLLKEGQMNECRSI